MFSTETNHEEWLQERKIAFEAYKDTQTKVPTEPEASRLLPMEHDAGPPCTRLPGARPTPCSINMGSP